MTIVEVLTEIVENIPVDPLFPGGTKFTLTDGEQYEGNENDGATYPYVFLIHPITSRPTTRASGLIEREYPVKLMFLNDSQLSDKQANRTANIESMKAALNTFYTDLTNHPSVTDFITTQNEEEVYNVFDDNADGYLISLNIKMVGETSCIQNEYKLAEVVYRRINPYATSVGFSLIQQGTAAPTSTELFDEFAGINFAWSRVSVGRYRLTADAACFTEGKTFIRPGIMPEIFGELTQEWVSTTQIDLLTSEGGGIADEVLYGPTPTQIIVEVYP